MRRNTLLALERGLLRTRGAWLRTSCSNACQKQPRCPSAAPSPSPLLLVSPVDANSLQPPAPPPQPGQVAAGSRAVQPAQVLLPELVATGGGGSRTGLPSSAARGRLLPLLAEEPHDPLHAAAHAVAWAQPRWEQPAAGGTRWTLLGPGRGHGRGQGRGRGEAQGRRARLEQWPRPGAPEVGAGTHRRSQRGTCCRSPSGGDSAERLLRPPAEGAPAPCLHNKGGEDARWRHKGASQRAG